jgi:hypothetical protein
MEISTDLAIRGLVVPLFIFMIKRYSKSKKPERGHPPFMSVGFENGTVRTYKPSDEEYKFYEKEYKKGVIKHILIYLVPLILCIIPIILPNPILLFMAIIWVVLSVVYEHWFYRVR